MHIGFDGSRINVAERTGTENYSYELLRSLVKQDQHNQYTVYSQHPLPDEFKTVSRLRNTVIPWPRLWTQAGLALELAKQKPDVLFIPAHTLPILHSPKLRSVVTIHDLGAEYLPQYHTFPGKLYLNRSTDYAVRFATHLIAVSKYTKQDLLKRYHINEQKISVVHEGVDLSSLSAASDQAIEHVKEKYALNQKYILFIGTIQPRKNLVRLIEAFSKVKEKNVNLVLAGKKGWLSEEIYQAPKRYNVQDRVKFLGYIDNQDKAALYSGAAITILPSLFEGFGLPLLESMACGTPVIAADATSLPEVVGDAGLLVDPKNTDEIAAAIDQLLVNSQLHQQLRERGFLQAKQFSWDKAAQKTLLVLEQVGKYGQS